MDNSNNNGTDIEPECGDTYDNEDELWDTELKRLDNMDGNVAPNAKSRPCPKHQHAHIRTRTRTTTETRIRILMQTGV